MSSETSETTAVAGPSERNVRNRAPVMAGVLRDHPPPSDPIMEVGVSAKLEQLTMAEFNALSKEQQKLLRKKQKVSGWVIVMCACVVRRNQQIRIVEILNSSRTILQRKRRGGKQ